MNREEYKNCLYKFMEKIIREDYERQKRKIEEADIPQDMKERLLKFSFVDVVKRGNK